MTDMKYKWAMSIGLGNEASTRASGFFIFAQFFALITVIFMQYVRTSYIILYLTHISRDLEYVLTDIAAATKQIL